MNQFQRRFVIDEVNEIVDRKKQELKAKFTIEGKDLEDTDRARLIRSGKVKLKVSIKELDHYDKVLEVFDFSEYEFDSKLDEKAFNKEFAKIEKQAAKIRNAAVLDGKTEDIQKMLEAFEP